MKRSLQWKWKHGELRIVATAKWSQIFCKALILFAARCILSTRKGNKPVWLVSRRLSYVITALFTNMRILKFKSQLTIAFFTAVNHLNEPLRKQNFTLTGSKGQGLWFVIGGFRSVLCVSVFQGSFLVIVIMTDSSEKRNCEGGFWTLEFACLWKEQ